MLTIDGSQGEGGGQILRTSLALSLVTGQPFLLENIRAGRPKPGLARQHLTCVEAATAIGRAEAAGAMLGSTTLEFWPGTVTPGDYRFAVGSAGSATLVLQTVLPPLLTAPGSTTLTLEGGTHNPLAPPFDFLARSFAPLIRRMGPELELELRRPGFFPAGGGQFLARIGPVTRLTPITLSGRGEIRRRGARVIASRLPENVAKRQLAALRTRLGFENDECAVEAVTNSPGPGNAVIIEAEAEHVTGVFSGFGDRGRLPETVALEASEMAAAWLEAGVPVDEHLADQLLIPLALAGGGSFRTTEPSLHSTTNAVIIQKFLPVEIGFERESEQVWRVVVRRAGEGT
jgi:RNA 3'-terminal phosphate cyclase (ATP)